MHVHGTIIEDKVHIGYTVVSSVCVAYRCRRSAWRSSNPLLTTLVTCWHRSSAISTKWRFHGKLITLNWEFLVQFLRSFYSMHRVLSVCTLLWLLKHL